MGLFGFFWNQQGGAKYKDAAGTYTHTHTYAHAHSDPVFFIYIYIDIYMYYCLPFSDSLYSCREYRWIQIQIHTHAHKHISPYVPGFIKALGKFFHKLQLYQTTVLSSLHF